jgi:hypothetical protein
MGGVKTGGLVEDPVPEPRLNVARNDRPMIWRVMGLTSFALWFASVYSDRATKNGWRVS